METKHNEALFMGSGNQKKLMIDSTSRSYDPMNEILPLMLGKFPTVSNSWPGNYGPPNLKNHNKAQRRKFEEYFRRLKLKPGMTVLEIGPGWGCFAEYCRQRGVNHISIVPAKGQYEYLRKAGYRVYHGIWQDFVNFDFGVEIDAVVSMGSPEHFVSPLDYKEGRQEQIYKDLFDWISKILKPGGMYGGQFMHFNGKFPTFEEMNPDAPKGTRARRLGLLMHFYPNAWCPRDFDHFFECGKHEFDLEEMVDGRIHYIWTMTAWGRIFRSPWPLIKWVYVFKYLLKSWFGRDAQFKYWAKCFWEKANKIAFIEGDLGHCFFFLKKK